MNAAPLTAAEVDALNAQTEALYREQEARTGIYVPDMVTTDEHRAADADHAVVPDSGYADEVSDNCKVCGLATYPDGSRHGFGEDA